jgi:hypothetical protein
MAARDNTLDYTANRDCWLQIPHLASCVLHKLGRGAYAWHAAQQRTTYKFEAANRDWWLQMAHGTAQTWSRGLTVAAAAQVEAAGTAAKNNRLV